MTERKLLTKKHLEGIVSTMYPPDGIPLHPWHVEAYDAARAALYAMDEAERLQKQSESQQKTIQGYMSEMDGLLAELQGEIAKVAALKAALSEVMTEHQRNHHHESMCAACVRAKAALGEEGAR